MGNIDVYSMTPDDKRRYLAGFPAAVFYEAAKIAGFKLPVGRPANDPTDNIARLVAVSPAICNGTISRLNRLFPNGYQATTADDWTDEGGPTAPVLSTPSPNTLQTPIAAVSAVSSGPVDNLALDALSGRVSRIEGYSIDAQTAGRIVRDALNPVENRVATLARETENQTRVLSARLDAVEKRAPVVIQTPAFTSAPISGQHYQFPRMVKWLTLRQYVLLIGPAGTGKTTAAINFADAMNLPLYSQPLSLDSTAVLGFVTATGGIVETEFYKAWVNGGVFLWDEITMSAPDAVGALNAALANGFCTLAGIGNVKKHPDFYCIAGDNSDTGASLEFSARSVLDGATLDRFRRIDWPVDPDIEAGMAENHTLWLAAIRAIRAFIKSNDIAHVGATPRGIIAGAQALSSGLFPGILGRREVLEDTMRKGVLIADWSRVENLPEVRAFLRGA